MKPVETVMRTAPVIPVLVIEDVAHARPIAEALVAGGLPVLEVTLRTAAALDVIAEMKKVPGAIVGAGTIVDIPGLESAIAAGAEFIVSPGLDRKSGQGSSRQGHSIPARHRQCGRYHARARPGPYPFQILPGRGKWRASGAQIADRAIRAMQILPHWRHQTGHRCRLAGRP